MEEFLLFTIHGRRYALPLSAVRRVVRMVEVIPLPEAAPTVAGMVNLHGEVVPVLDLRRHIGLPRPPRPSDHLLIATAGERPLALAIDSAEGIFTSPADKPSSGQGDLPGEGYLSGIVTVAGEIVHILDLGRLQAAAGIRHLEAAGAAAS